MGRKYIKRGRGIVRRQETKKNGHAPTGGKGKKSKKGETPGKNPLHHANGTFEGGGNCSSNKG